MILPLQNSEKGLGRDEILLRIAIEERMSNLLPRRIRYVCYVSNFCAKLSISLRRPHSLAFISCSGSFVQIVDWDVHDGVDDDYASSKC